VLVPTLRQQFHYFSGGQDAREAKLLRVLHQVGCSAPPTLRSLASAPLMLLPSNSPTYLFVRQRRIESGRRRMAPRGFCSCLLCRRRGGSKSARTSDGGVRVDESTAVALRVG
jgi:hypothetical protein